LVNLLSYVVYGPPTWNKDFKVALELESPGQKIGGASSGAYKFRSD